MEDVRKYLHLSNSSIGDNKDTFNKDELLSSPSL